MKQRWILFGLMLFLWTPLAQTQSNEPNSLVVVARRDIDIDALTKEQVVRIFFKQMPTLPNGKTIEPIDFPEGSTTYADFYAKVSNKSVVQMQIYWGRQGFTGMSLPPKRFANAAEVRGALLVRNDLLAYLPKKEVTEQLKILFDPAK
jgi:hypothetical protein